MLTNDTSINRSLAVARGTRFFAIGKYFNDHTRSVSLRSPEILEARD
jgi:hypothetical protein